MSNKKMIAHAAISADDALIKVVPAHLRDLPLTPENITAQIGSIAKHLDLAVQSLASAGGLIGWLLSNTSNDMTKNLLQEQGIDIRLASLAFHYAQQEAGLLPGSNGSPRRLAGHSMPEPEVMHLPGDELTPNDERLGTVIGRNSELEYKLRVLQAEKDLLSKQKTQADTLAQDLQNELAGITGDYTPQNVDERNLIANLEAYKMELTAVCGRLRRLRVPSGNRPLNALLIQYVATLRAILEGETGTLLYKAGIIPSVPETNIDYHNMQFSTIADAIENNLDNEVTPS